MKGKKEEKGRKREEKGKEGTRSDRNKRKG